MLCDDLQAVFPSFPAEECTEARNSFEDVQMARERFLSLVLKQEEQRKMQRRCFKTENQSLHIYSSRFRS